ncbi:MAG TPA: glycosyltransferase family 1 protein [Chromatiaceae bacterium]|nr:glycosyltransferase family 1 protein [Chromatiaceae bacterium]
MSEVSREINQAVTVVYLGAAREEKGFLLLPELIGSLYEVLGKSEQLRFVIQCSPQIVGYLPSIKVAIEKLRQFPSDYVELRDKPQSTKDYYEMLSGSDVVMLCYDHDRYRVRGSGIAVEAVALGKILLSTKGTFPEFLSGSGAASGSTVTEVSAALEDVVARFEHYRAEAAQVGKSYRESYTPKAYIESMLKNIRCSEAPDSDRSVSAVDAMSVTRGDSGEDYRACLKRLRYRDEAMAGVLLVRGGDAGGALNSDVPRYGVGLDYWIRRENSSDS